MKKNPFVWAMLLIASFMTIVQPVLAAELYVKSVPLVWERMDKAVNPAVGAHYTVGLSDGNHPAAGNGIAVAPQDTSQAIDIRDNWLRLKQLYVTGPNGGATGSSVQDTMGVFATATFRSVGPNSSTIDSLTIFRDYSSDGMEWVPFDSLGGHVIADTVWNASSAVSDSVRAWNGVPSVVVFNNPAYHVVSYSWNANPWWGPNQVTAQAANAFNYIRFRVHMTPGDFAAAGNTNGWSGSLQYLAIEPNVSIPH